MSPVLSPPVADLSTRLDALDESLRARHGAKGLADAWGKSFGEAPARLELSTPAAAGDAAKHLAACWGRENAA
jgi:hypothetical protein